MKFRKDKNDILSNLYVQSGLEEALALPSDLRPHYLSLVLRLPKNVSQKLTLRALDWTNNWAHQSYYVQRHDTLHITLVDIGRTCSFQSSLQTIIGKVNKFLGDTKPQFIRIKLSEAKIGSSGINCELDPDKELDNWIGKLGEAISVGTVKAIDKRSISLIRYRTQNNSDWDLIRTYLMKLGAPKSEDASFRENISFDEMSLVRLDKVAQYFDILHTFQV